MSFSGEMKEEIARLIPEKEEEVRAELMAIIRFCGRILRQEESVAVFMETENVVLAKTYVKLIKRAFDLQVQLEIRRHGTGKYNQYFILLSERPEDMLYSEERPERQKLQQALRAICMWSAQADPRGFLKTPGSMRAYIRGAFLCTGSMSDPGRTDGDHPLLRKNPQAGRERGSFHGNRECRAGKDVCQINKKSI